MQTIAESMAMVQIEELEIQASQILFWNFREVSIFASPRQGTFFCSDEHSAVRGTFPCLTDTNLRTVRM
jgi:hypothetical protein